MLNIGKREIKTMKRNLLLVPGLAIVKAMFLAGLFLSSASSARSSEPLTGAAFGPAVISGQISEVLGDGQFRIQQGAHDWGDVWTSTWADDGELYSISAAC